MLRLVFKSGDILKSDALMLVNPVNTHGVMGAGLAKQFKSKFPNNYAEYVDYCHSKGKSFDKFRVHVSEDSGKLICNLPTKEDWRNLSKLRYIRKSLIYLSFYLNNYPDRDKLTKIAIPPIGCGLGGLAQLTVLHLILYHLKFVEFPLTLELYGFKDVPKKKKDYFSNHYDLTHRQLHRFTGVGSRKLSALGEDRITDILPYLRKRNYLLCTGDAYEGGDVAFWGHYEGAKIRFGPLNRENPKKDVQIIDPEQPQYHIARKLAASLHPAWRWLNEPTRELHTRNVFQVMGARITRPSEFLVCWTPDGAETETTKKTGGTAMAIKVANYYGIPVFNLRNDDALERLADFLSITLDF